MDQTHRSSFIFVDTLLKNTELCVKCNIFSQIIKYKNITTKRRHKFINSEFTQYKNDNFCKQNCRNNIALLCLQIIKITVFFS